MMITEDMATHKGQQTFRSIVLPAACVGNNEVKDSDPIEQDKLEHQHRVNYSQAHGSASVDERRVVHVVRGAGATLKQVVAGVSVACLSGATITVDVLKNGTTILTAPIEIDDADVAYDLVAGVIDDADLAQDDVLEVVVDVTAGGGTVGQGVFAALTIAEDAD